MFAKMKNSSKESPLASIEDMLTKSIGFRINLLLEAKSFYYQVRNAEKVSPSAAMVILRAHPEKHLWKDFDEIILSPADKGYHSLQYGEDLEKVFQDGKICLNSNSMETSDPGEFKAGLDCTMSLWRRHSGFVTFNRNNSILWVAMTEEKISYRAIVCNHFNLESRKKETLEEKSSAFKAKEPLTLLLFKAFLTILFTWSCI